MLRRKKWLLFTVMLAALFITACGSTAPAGEPGLLGEYTVRPITDIVDTDLIVTNFARDGSATLPIRTSVPVACTMVYGKTPAFGSLTLDQDMAGGTHSDHNPLLTGLEPETTYYFRVQGVDDDGVLYVSETMTFTTPPQDTSETLNLASLENGGQVMGFSSAFGGAAAGERFGAGSAFDDNPNTEWSSAGDGDQAWIEVALANRARIQSIQFQTRSMSDGSAITLAFTITTDGGEVLGPFEVPAAGEPYEFDASFEAQTLRFDLVDTTGGNTGVVDIAVFGEFVE